MLFFNKKKKLDKMPSGLVAVFMCKNGQYEFVRLSNSVDIPKKFDMNTYVALPICWKESDGKEVMHVTRENYQSEIKGSDEFIFKNGANVDTNSYDTYAKFYSISEGTLEKVPGDTRQEKCTNLLLYYLDGLKLVRNEKGGWKSKFNPTSKMAMSLKNDLINSEKDVYELLYEYSVVYDFDYESFMSVFEQVAVLKGGNPNEKGYSQMVYDSVFEYALYLEEIYADAKLGYSDFPSLYAKHANNPLNLTDVVSNNLEHDDDSLLNLRRKKVVLEEVKEHLGENLSFMFDEDEELEKDVTNYVLEAILKEATNKVDKELDSNDIKEPTPEEIKGRLF